MDIRRTFTQQLNFRYVNQPVDLSLFESLVGAADPAIQPPTDARVMFEGKGVQVLRLTIGALNGAAEKACIRVLRKHYPDAVYLFANIKADNDGASYHLCNDAGKQLALTPEKQRLFQEKIAFFEVTDDVTGTLDLKERIAKAFETEKLTRKFYAEFQKYRELLLKFLKGIPLEEDRNWYASVLLNRLMFIYFIQKRGFIGGNQDWLRQQLAAREESGENYFAQFLQPLFFRGFALPKGARGAHEALFADVPYLNGGLFQRHVIEERCPAIAVDNKVLRQLLDYFHKYHWYLDDRPLRDENEINPDVLGYIFEKYVNQKQMGAYYTQEDITGYICKHTILPFVLDKLARLQGAGQAQGAPLPLPIMAANIDRYVHEAVKTEDTLPTETAREHQARRKRCAQIQADAAQGRIAAVNDLVTYNLDIVTYADDAIAQFDEHALSLFYFECLQKATVLDPTCGSGAFLFAALNILLPLYLACLLRIREFAAARPRRGCASEHARFTAELARVRQHDNERYYTVKSIIVNNLYGVDIMEEATEICKLRLFLRLAAEIQDPARIEPLPDIDFNVRAGNTLVGFATRDGVQQALSTSLHGDVPQGKFFTGDAVTDEAMREIDRQLRSVDLKFQAFHKLQTGDGIPASALAPAKQDLRAELTALNDELNRALAREYGVALPVEKGEARTAAGRKGKAPVNTLAENSAYSRWLESHQPFHWFAEFYGILNGGGFDVVVGNPPYVVYSEQKVAYKVDAQGYRTLPTKNLYALVFERAIALARKDSPIGFIVQLTVLSSEYLPPLQDILMQRGHLWAIPFPRRPESIFDGVEMPVAILISSGGPSGELSTSRVKRFYTVERNNAMTLVGFVTHSIRVDKHRIAKIGTSDERSMLSKLLSNTTTLNSLLADKSEWGLYYQEACRYWAKAYPGMPFFRRNGSAIAPPHGRTLLFQSQNALAFGACLLNSSLFYWYYSALSDCEHVNDGLIRGFPIARDWETTDWTQLADSLSKSLAQNAKRKVISTAQGHTIEYDELKALHSKPIIDKIDSVLARHYGFTGEELDFIINYDIKYRMGQDNQEEAEE